MIRKQLFLTLILPIGLIFCTSCGLFEAKVIGNYTLPETMITIDGNTVDQIFLSPGESAILTYKNKRPDSDLIVHSEIRTKKTVRLGGYFYAGFEDGSDISDRGLHISERQLDWVSVNIDILSLNTYYNPAEEIKMIYPNEVKFLKEKNPKFRFYNMVFGTTMIEPTFDPETMSEWTLKYTNGQEAIGLRRENGSSPNHVMDMNNKEYADFFKNYITDHAQEYHADGVFIDEIMWQGYWGINTIDLKDYNSDKDYNNASLNFLKRIGENSTIEIIHQAFWDEAQQYTHGVWGEYAFKFNFYRNDNYIFYRNMTYDEIIQKSLELSSRNETYIWAAWYRLDNSKDFEHVLSTYLLGKGSNSVVFQPHPIFGNGYGSQGNLAGYDIKTFENEYNKYKKYLDVELGNPVGDPEKNLDGIWVRIFENGMVFSHPNI